MTSVGEDEAHFSLLGLVLILSATAMAGFRWSMAQLMLQKLRIETEDGSDTGQNGLDPITTLYLISPAATAALVPLMIGVELPSLLESTFFAAPGVGLEFAGVVLATGLLAFGLIFLELQLVHLTSGLTCSICGVMKELLTIVASVAYFRDAISGLNVVGMAVSTAGILGYNAYRRHQEQSGGLWDQGYAKVAAQDILEGEFGAGESDTEELEFLSISDPEGDDCDDDRLYGDGT
jgi:solute carrier family 35 protein C2